MSQIPALTAVTVASLIALPVGAPAAPPSTPVPSAAASPDQPVLSIAVDNGRTSSAAGDQLTYKITLRNLGTTNVRGLEVTQSLPAGLALIRADRHGSARPGRVVWPAELKAGQVATFTTVTRLGQTADEVLRLATVACATTRGAEKPLVCATHSDLLPAGAGARAGGKSDPRGWTGLVAAAAGLAILGLAAAVVLRRRRRRPRSAAETGSHPVDASGVDASGAESSEGALRS